MPGIMLQNFRIKKECIMTEYYSDNLITLYLGDARDVMPQLTEKFSAVITDPVWPNYSEVMFPNVKNAYNLLADVSQHWPALTDRACVILGCDSDPRILSVIPKSLKFLRVSMLEYVVPSRKGRVLNGFDVAYIFGTPLPIKESSMLMPGRCIETHIDKKDRSIHPCPRRLEHMKWLTKWYGGNGPVLDPFAGSCTTLIASKIAGIKSVGIEINEQFAEKAVKQIEKYYGIFDSWN